jgi:hypothetical protein
MLVDAKLYEVHTYMRRKGAGPHQAVREILGDEVPDLASASSHQS